MAFAFLTLRSIVFACGFLWLWTWIAGRLRAFDPELGGPLAAWAHPLGLACLILGGVVAAWCVGSFIARGRGTPALFDAPRRLVAVGPYRYMRNPMYIGGALLLLGLGLAERSPAVVLFVPAWWLLFHLLVILYEEPTLRSKFGSDYDVYCHETPRWVPRLHPHHGA
ncbi:MAG TPA: isoprenylcysteine carboxylmethyltransferase family protein [Bryobacteraceae bacterium]|nr:isoprenylcysteine carboxylmethyltransferase family protein [Bryobacteraceae bacterium]